MLEIFRKKVSDFVRFFRLNFSSLPRESAACLILTRAKKTDKRLTFDNGKTRFNVQTNMYHSKTEDEHELSKM